SNSRPLVADTGYWAESLPLMDAPLCAVIDPIRDYRWHALRCGGPETASFLCEMPVPTWADVCILKDMPNLTMQYMADTASIELIRNCQEEGLLRTTCQGKQDRERALQDLICPRERLEAQRINDITTSHFKSLQIINSIPSDNNENNDIELLPMDVSYGPAHYSGGEEDLQTEKNTVQRLIEQFNVDELMQADEPANMERVSSFYKIPGLIPKPVKKSAKKVVEYPKKENGKKQTVVQDKQGRVPLEMDEMMLGDQPQGEPEMPEQILNEEVSNEILEPLPHIKKTNIHKEAMEKMEKEAIAIKESMQRSKEMEAQKKKAAEVAAAAAIITTTTMATTTEEITTTTGLLTTTTMKPETSSVVSSTTEAFVVSSSTSNPGVSTTTKDVDVNVHQETSTPLDLESSTLGHGSAIYSSTTPPATIGHPMHPQQPRSTVITEETQHGHVKESADNSHFIPPMLMVKSHYVPQANKHGHNEHQVHAPHAPGQQQQHMDAHDTTHYNEDLTTKSHSDMAMTTAKVIDFESSTTTTASTTLKSKDIERTSEANHHQHQNHQEQQKIDKAEKKITPESDGHLQTKPFVEETTENGNMIPITQSEFLTKEEEPEEQQIGKHNENMKLEQEVLATSHANAVEVVTTPATPLTSTIIITSTAESLATESTTTTTSTINPHEDKTSQTTTMKLVEQTESPNTSDDIADKTELPADAVRATQAIVMKEIQSQPAADMDEDGDDDAMETEQTTKLVEETAATAMTTQGHSVVAAELKHDLVTETPTPAGLTTTENTAEQETTKITPTTITATTNVEVQTSQTTTQTTTTAIADDTKRILAKDIQTTSGLITDQENEQHKAKATETTEGNEAAVKGESATGITTEKASESTSSRPTTTLNPNTETQKENNTNAATTQATTTFETTSSSTITPPISSPLPSSTSTTTTTTTTTTPPPPFSSSTETTRNFLKVTTEMPFKPNRRRSLTKPETVSYMKKILG
ncbi:mucin-2, partial [Musca vetustissima]|uniref:mucin-2 n=1 Tax=Musca vetustissima TaxID=27455 RepID=UPI002AB65164